MFINEIKTQLVCNNLNIKLVSLLKSRLVKDFDKKFTR